MKIECIQSECYFKKGTIYNAKLNNKWISVLDDKQFPHTFNIERGPFKEYFKIVEEKEDNEMKKYKIYEVLKMIEENKELKFTDDIYDIFYDKDFNIVRFINKSNHKISINGIGLGKEFYLINQPVTFEEVLNSDKRCKVEHELLHEQLEYQPLDNLMYYLANSRFGNEFKKILKEGKWYLED